MNRAAFLAGIVTLAILGAPAAADQAYDPIEAWDATTVQMDIGKMVVVRIGVMEWSTDEEHEAVIQAMQEGGAEAVTKYLHDQSEKGYIKFPNANAYQMRYAVQAEHNGQRYVVMATDRPVGNIGVRTAQETWGNNISLLSLILDPNTGKGTGTMIAGAEISIDPKTGHLDIAPQDTDPIRFTSVKAIKLKQKKKD